MDVSAKPALGPGEFHCYAYEIVFSPIPNAQAYRNHAIVTILNHSGRLGEPWGPEPKAGFSLPEHPTVSAVDASARGTDVAHCPSGFACAPSETGPWDFQGSGQVVFTKVVTNVAACDATAGLHNIATLRESDTHETRTAEATVHLTAPPCPVGCVWTPGFWKTHPDAWPSGFHPVDPCFSSGKTWREALWTPPRGDAYFILAHPYIAAALNRASGASLPSEVEAAFNAATKWFGSHRPGVPAASPDGQEVIRHAEVLAAYNEGLTTADIFIISHFSHEAFRRGTPARNPPPHRLAVGSRWASAPFPQPVDGSRVFCHHADRAGENPAGSGRAVRSGPTGSSPGRDACGDPSGGGTAKGRSTRHGSRKPEGAGHPFRRAR